MGQSKNRGPRLYILQPDSLLAVPILGRESSLFRGTGPCRSLPTDPQKVLGNEFQPLPVRPCLRAPIPHFKDEPRRLRSSLHRAAGYLR